MCTGATEKQRSDVKHIRYSHFVLTVGLLPLLWGKLMWQWWGAGQGSSGTLQADGAGRAGTHAFALFFLFSGYLCQRERNLLCTAVVQPLSPVQKAEPWGQVHSFSSAGHGEAPAPTEVTQGKHSRTPMFCSQLCHPAALRNPALCASTVHFVLLCSWFCDWCLLGIGEMHGWFVFRSFL